MPHKQELQTGITNRNYSRQAHQGERDGERIYQVILYLFRHGAAEPWGVSDSARQLTAQGHQQNLATATRWLVQQPEIDRALVSPYVRARQTAADINQLFPQLDFIEHPGITPDDDPRAVLDELSTLSDESVLLVSHNPLLSKLATMLVDGAYSDSVRLDTSEVICLSLSEVAIGCGEIRYHISPVQNDQ